MANFRGKSSAGARLCAIRVLWFRQKNRSASELTRILNDECKFHEYVHLHCLQILYEQKIASFELESRIVWHNFSYYRYPGKNILEFVYKFQNFCILL